VIPKAARSAATRDFLSRRGQYKAGP